MIFFHFLKRKTKICVCLRTGRRRTRLFTHQPDETVGKGTEGGDATSPEVEGQTDQPLENYC